MAVPVYVLLPDGVEWNEVPGTTSQRPAPIRWYLRQHMVEATTQTAVLVDGDEGEVEQRTAEVARQAQELGGMAVDAGTQDVIDPSVRTPG